MKKIVERNTTKNLIDSKSKNNFTNKQIMSLGKASTLTLGTPGKYWEVVSGQLRTSFQLGG